MCLPVLAEFAFVTETFWTDLSPESILLGKLYITYCKSVNVSTIRLKGTADKLIDTFALWWV